MNAEELKTLKTEPDARGFRGCHLNDSARADLAMQLSAFAARGGEIQVLLYADLKPLQIWKITGISPDEIYRIIYGK